MIELPQTEKSCEGKSIAPPRSAPCSSFLFCFRRQNVEFCFLFFIDLDLACQPGRALDTETLKCANCPSGSFSLGGGQQYTFDENKPLDRIEGLTVNAIPLIGLSNDQCVKEKSKQIDEKENVFSLNRRFFQSLANQRKYFTRRCRHELCS